MSLKTWLMPVISQRWLGVERLNAQRDKAERRRMRDGARHTVHYFHQVDDPYSALAVEALPKLLAHYDVDLEPHLVGPPGDDAAPERAKLMAYSRKDASLLNARWNLGLEGFAQAPGTARIATASAQLTASIAARQFVQDAPQICRAVWQPALQCDAPLASAAEIQDAIASGNALRKRWGHYLGAMFFYAGEWYWGLDRLHHLELRLRALQALRGSATGQALLYPMPPDRLLSPRPVSSHPPEIDFYLSLRSPYSAIVAPRVFKLAEVTGAQVNLRFVLPMVMRGLPVPREKRQYIALDAAREARARHVPFGRVNDPVGRPTERGLAIIPTAVAQGRGQAYIESFMQGVWAEGCDAGSDRGLRRIVERAGLTWSDAQTALQDESWRETAEENRQAMWALGLWGVPSFSVGQVAVWGQDRLWAVEEALQGACVP